MREIVISIPDEEYKYIKQYCRPNDERQFVSNMINRIARGTLLPKGHGTLKDTDAICKDIISALGIRDESYLLEAEKAIYKRIKNADAIIDADKVENEVEE